jgi:hypothetical protein
MQSINSEQKEVRFQTHQEKSRPLVGVKHSQRVNDSLFESSPDNSKHLEMRSSGFQSKTYDRISVANPDQARQLTADPPVSADSDA